MKFCPKVYKITAQDVDDDGLHFRAKEYEEDIVQKVENCCDLILQCDMEKRAELNYCAVEEGTRHCECENKFRECLIKPKRGHLQTFGVEYFMKTRHFYSLDHPKIECELARLLPTKSNIQPISKWTL